MSITSLYIILSNDRLQQFPFLILALIAGIASNVYIVGLNQVADVHIDKINKPWLPIPAQQLTIKQAKTIVAASLLLSLAVAFYMTPWFLAIIALASAIGWAYSMPPFHLKAHHIPAAIAISSVRGVLVNLGAFLVFTQLVDQNATLHSNIVVLTIVITVCGIVIAWFKDLPDMKGDAEHNVKTFAVVHSPKSALITGTVLMSVTYLFAIAAYASSQIPESTHYNKNILLYGHILLFLLFIAHSFTARVNKHESITRFYKRFWIFFFAEYAMYAAAYY